MTNLLVVAFRRAVPVVPLALVLGVLLLATPARAQVGRWEVHGKVKATVRIQGHTKHSHGRLQAVFLMFDDGTYQQPGNFFCGSASDVTEEGVWQNQPGRNVALSPTNLVDILSVAADCTGYDYAIDTYGHQFHLNKAGTHLGGVTTMSGSVSAGGDAYPFHATAHYQGKRVSVTPAVRAAAAADGGSVGALLQSAIGVR